MPEHVVPIRMRREAGHDGLAQLTEGVRKAGHLVASQPGIDEQYAVAASYDNGVVLEQLTLVEQHILRDLPQHG